MTKPLPDPVILSDLQMRIARDGTWFYHGSPIGRKPLVRLFASVLSRDEDGENLPDQPDGSREVTDIWTFARDTRNRDPNWQLIETHGEN